MLTAREKRIVLLLAKENMRQQRVCDLIQLSRSTVNECMDSIKAKTGLNPRSFYDLRELVSMVDPKARPRLTYRKAPLPEEYQNFILAIAERNLKLSPACSMVHITDTGGVHWTKRIQEITGLSPRKFYELETLVDFVKGGMTLSGRNPCDLCHRKECEDCVLVAHPKECTCANYDCFLNYDGSCVLSLFDECGAWEG